MKDKNKNKNKELGMTGSGASSFCFWCKMFLAENIFIKKVIFF